MLLNDSTKNMLLNDSPKNMLLNDNAKNTLLKVVKFIGIQFCMDF